jgi:hypothetical protein
MAVYATAKALGLGFKFTPLGCVGHIGKEVHYRKSKCNNLGEADMQELQRVRELISLPSTAPANASRWHAAPVFKATFQKVGSWVYTWQKDWCKPCHLLLLVYRTQRLCLRPVDHWNVLSNLLEACLTHPGKV